MNKVLVLLAVMLLAATSVIAAGQGTGFDQYGYNDKARVFVGTGESWSLAKGLPADYLGIYAADKLTMKWNAEWDLGNLEGWANPPYDAYLNNEWNGNVPGGSGESEIFKCRWYGPCTEGETLPSGGTCIWGQFEVLMDHYIGGSFLKANPVGYGAQ